MEIDIDKERVAFEAWVQSEMQEERYWFSSEQVWLAAKRHAAQVSEPSGASVDSDRLAYLLDAYDRAGETAGAEYSAAYKAIVAHIDAWHAEQTGRMRSAFHINMLRAHPDKSHEQIAAEIAKACGEQSLSVDSVARDAAQRLLKAATVYAFDYCQDEADDESVEDGICDLDQRNAAVELFAAIAAMSPTKAGEGM